MNNASTPSPIAAVLFDADGVLQRPSVWWRQAFGQLLGTTDTGRIDAFARDFDTTERSALCASTGFEITLASMLERWNLSEQLNEVLQILTTIEVYGDIMDAIQALRSSGVPCHLATNQQAHRARHMSEVMAYRELFDREFYSCHLGVAKPEAGYFTAILRALDLTGPSVLFLDDREDNVLAAQRAGLRAAVYDGSEGVTALRRVLGNFGVRLGAPGAIGLAGPA